MKFYHLFCLILFPTILFAQKKSFKAHADFAFELDSAQATAHYLDSLIQFSSESISEDTVAYFYHRIGLKYFFQNLYRPACHYTRKGAEIREGLSNEEGSTIDALSRSYSNLGGFYRLLFQETFQPSYADSVLFYFEKVISLGASKENLNYPNACKELGLAYSRKEDYDRATQYFNQGIRYCRELPNPSIEIRGDLAKLYLDAEDVWEVNKTVSLANRMTNMKQAIDTLEEHGYYPDLALAYGKLAYIYSEQNRKAEAVKAFEQTVYWNEELVAAEYQGKTEEWRRQLGFAWNNFGNFYLENGDYKQAKTCFEKSLRIKENRYGQGKHPEKGSYYVNVGEMRLLQAKPEEALVFFQEGIENLVPQFTSKTLEDLPSTSEMRYCSFKANLLYALQQKVNALVQTNNTNGAKSALETLACADKLVDLMRQEQRATESKYFWREKTKSLYEEAINLAYEAGDVTRAFYFFEKSKAVLLGDALNAVEARKALPEKLAIQERQLLVKLEESRAAYLLDETEDSAFLQAERDYQLFLEELEKSYPKYFQTLYATEVPELKESGQVYSFTDSTEYVHLFYGERYYFALRFGNGKTGFIRRERNLKSDSLVQNYLSQFQSSFAISNQPQVYKTQAFALYDYLLGGLFEEQKIPQELVLITDDYLSLLPFGALMVNKEGRQEDYFLLHSNLHYAYSIGVLQRQETSSLSSSDVLGFAPFTNATDEWSLPFSGSELKAIEDLSDGTYVYDAEARKQYFIEEASKHSVLHLSTHAREEGKNGVPQIFFTDGYLNLSELYAMDLKNDLIVLSACETGLGEVKKGEGVLSLTRGFTYAGANSIVSSLWKVNDASTSQIISDFYKNISLGMTKSLALQKAKRDFLLSAPPDLQSPYYWAGLTFTGADGQLKLEKRRPFWLWIGLISVCIFLAVRLFKK